MSLPHDLKSIAPYLQRSQELQTKDPIMAYYCKYYALQEALAITSDSSKPYLFELMDQLETEKTTLAPSIGNEQEMYTHVERFALKVFIKADNEDREDRATANTARIFIASSQFFQLLSIFGDVDPAILEKIKYAKFKAVDITKAIKNGLVPQSGPPHNETEEEKEEENEPNHEVDEPLNQENDHTANEIHSIYHSQDIAFPSVPQTISPIISSTIIPSIPALPCLSDIPDQLQDDESDDPFTYDFKSIANASKHAKFAISSLQYEDISTAIENLEKSLALLHGLNKKTE